jgi:hypothetical protein
MRCPARARPLAALSPVLLLALAACGGSGGSGGGTGGTPQASSSPTPGGASASASVSGASGKTAEQITAHWEAFFNAKTPLAQRVKYLQNGHVFAPVLRAQARSALASAASAKVSKVAVSPHQAKVTYTILVSGQPMLKDRTGVAVRQGGVWKVGDTSFCGLLRLENQGSASSLPPACGSGG